MFSHNSLVLEVIFAKTLGPKRGGNDKKTKKREQPCIWLWRTAITSDRDFKRTFKHEF